MQKATAKQVPHAFLVNHVHVAIPQVEQGGRAVGGGGTQATTHEASQWRSGSRRRGSRSSALPRPTCLFWVMHTIHGRRSHPIQNGSKTPLAAPRDASRCNSALDHGSGAARALFRWLEEKPHAAVARQRAHLPIDESRSCDERRHVAVMATHMCSAVVLRREETTALLRPTARARRALRAARVRKRGRVLRRSPAIDTEARRSPPPFGVHPCPL